MSRLLRIAAREYASYVRTAGFWLSLVIMPLVLLAALAAPAMMDRTTPPTRLVVIDMTRPARAQGAEAGLGEALAARLRAEPPGSGVPQILPVPPEAANAPSAAAARAQVRALLGGTAERHHIARPFDAAVILSGDPAAPSLELWSDNLTEGVLESLVRSDFAEVMRRHNLIQAGVRPALIDAADRTAPKVTLYSPRAAAGAVSIRDQLPAILGLSMGLLLWSAILTGAGILLNGVIEEKSSRILEMLLTSASASEVMGGKILGVMGITATVLAVWLAIASGAAALTAPRLLTAIVAVLMAKGLIVFFALNLVIGYVMYASIFAAVGAFCETVREAQTLLGPMMLVLSAPLLFMGQSIAHPDAPLLAVLTWIPPFTPFLMVARAASDPPLWQVCGALALMAATTVAVVWISGRAFRSGALAMGKGRSAAR
ncbi:MAG: ABC transporter permease [Caulobacteraceae bacterium]|nr:ABC transporter permease [Caulobacteraceae bacterium]